MRKRLLQSFLLVFVALVAAYVWFVHVNYRFEPISAGKVYKSAAIPPEKLERFISGKGIKTVIDLRDPGVQDALNPANQREIDAEAEALAKIGGVRHINIPSRQVPTKETLTRFFEVLDDKQAYPVLIHCHHGTGRAEIYSAIYRIEYEGWSNADARARTRPVVAFAGYRSSFADGEPKGDFLMHYKPRKEGEESTLFQLAGEPATSSSSSRGQAVNNSADDDGKEQQIER
jgi:protein tyrosine phosphatase (PTP) superfamily phosphohydrolase (DUF442 family)